jgi:hypothetical protein
VQFDVLEENTVSKLMDKECRFRNRSFYMQIVVMGSKEVGKGIESEQCRFLGYKNPVCTSEETQCVSATEPSRLLICKISVFMAVTMKNAFFWDIKTQFVLHRRHAASLLQRPAS